MKEKEFRLGVLFVHGIGTQPQRDTLVRWGDVLLKVIGRATAEGPDRTIPIVGRADAGDRSGDYPAEVAVEFHGNDPGQARNGRSARLVGGQLSGTHLFRTGLVEFSRGAMQSRCTSRSATGRPAEASEAQCYGPF